jgi:hypothetical protein
LTQNEGVPLFDFATVRNTLAYIRDDKHRAPAPARELIEATLAELLAVERRRLAPIPICILKINTASRRKF